MPRHPPKKQKLESAVVAGNDFSPSFDDLVDVLPNILGCLTPKDIMRSRRINKKTREAVKKTVVPLTKKTAPRSDFRVHSVDEYNGMVVMAEAMPNLQEITISYPGYKYNDGEDPDEDYAARTRTADRTSLDIEIISNFRNLRILDLFYAELNGRYPFLFNSFPLLQKLSIRSCRYIKWDLDMLAGLPLLKELDCFSNSRLTGNINNLRELKDTLEKVKITYCDLLEGNFMDLADFPHLKVLDLGHTAVTGDIRDIDEHDFSSLEQLTLPKGVYGGTGCEFQRISDGPDVARAVHLLKKQRPALKMDKDWCANLSEDSPDCYASADVTDTGAPPFYIPFVQDTPPFFIHFVQAGSRFGYRWTTKMSIPCEVNWLDPEPDTESSDYEEYIAKIQKIERGATLFMYRGFHHPPTEEEYNRLFEEEVQRDRAQGIPQVSFT